MLQTHSGRTKRRVALSVIGVVFSLVGGSSALTASAHAETATLFDAGTYSFGPVTPFSLLNGQHYEVTVSGTYSVWPSETWNGGTCGGTPGVWEGSPETGPTGLDGQYVFSEPTSSSFVPCTSSFPVAYGGACVITQDANRLGAQYEECVNHTESGVSAPQEYSPAHVYHLTVTGTGEPAGVSIANLKPVFEFEPVYGGLWVTITGPLTEGNGGGGGSGVPVNTSSPAISGTPDVGETLSCSSGSWSGDTPQTYTYTWIRDRTVVAGPGSQSTYIPTVADQGHQIECEVNATNAAGSASASSAAVNVSAAPCPLSDPFCGQQDYQTPDIKIVQYIKKFNEVPGTNCLSALNSLGVIHIDSIILCTGLEQSANPDPPSYLGGSAYQALVNSKEYRGLIHINPFTVQCTNGQVTATSPQSGDYSTGYTPIRVPVIGTLKYDAAEPFSAPPFGYLYNTNPFPFAIDGGNRDVLVLDAGRLAKVPRELLFEDSGYDAPFIWTELKGSIGCGSYSLRLRVSNFPSVAVYVNNKLVEGLTQSNDIATFTAQGCKAFGATGVGRFDFNRNLYNVVLTASGASLQPELSDPSAYYNPAWEAQTCTSSGATTAALRVATPTLKAGAVTATFTSPTAGKLIAQVTGRVTMARAARHPSGATTQTTVLVATHRGARAKRPLKLVLRMSRVQQLELRRGRIGGLKLVLTLIESNHGVVRTERNIHYRP